jgi:hypothetical protein
MINYHKNVIIRQHFTYINEEEVDAVEAAFLQKFRTDIRLICACHCATSVVCIIQTSTIHFISISSFQHFRQMSLQKCDDTRKNMLQLSIWVYASKTYTVQK